MEMKNLLLRVCGFELSSKWELLYRGSVHGFEADAFHHKCNFYGNTLTIIKSQNGRIFGGFTEASWDSCSGVKSDKNAFLFRLSTSSESARVGVAKGKEDNAIYCCGKLGPTFGYNLIKESYHHTINKSDLSVYSENKGATYFGKFYSLLKHSSETTEQDVDKYDPSTFLNGSNYFKVYEIEVFQRK